MDCVCDICGIDLQKVEDLVNHHRLFHGKKIFYCSYCDVQFTDSKSFQKHFEKNHSLTFAKGDTNLGPEKQHGQSFNEKSCSPSTLQEISSLTKVFACSICRKRFATKFNLQIHYRKHSTMRPFVCKTCGKSYKHEKDLRHHKIVSEYCVR